ncbi:MAG: site-specific DNA-methyltransferase, partial [Acidobacteriota bacterium]
MNTQVLTGDCRKILPTLPAGSAQMSVTSPPYWGLRDYGEGQIGLEERLEDFIGELVGVFREIRRVLSDDGTLWIKLGDTYLGGRIGGVGKSSILGSHRNHEAVRRAAEARPGKRHRSVEGLAPKNLLGIPWRVALALQADGWILRSEVIWHKPCPLPESAQDRPSRAHEQLFLFAKSARYFYNADAIREPLAAKTATTWGSGRRFDGDRDDRNAASNWARSSAAIRRPNLDAGGKLKGANKRTVWTIAPEPDKACPHTSRFPGGLVEPCILAGSAPG